MAFGQIESRTRSRSSVSQRMSHQAREAATQLEQESAAKAALYAEVPRRSSASNVSWGGGQSPAGAPSTDRSSMESPVSVSPRPMRKTTKRSRLSSVRSSMRFSIRSSRLGGGGVRGWELLRIRFRFARGYVRGRTTSRERPTCAHRGDSACCPGAVSCTSNTSSGSSGALNRCESVAEGVSSRRSIGGSTRERRCSAAHLNVGVPGTSMPGVGARSASVSTAGSLPSSDAASPPPLVSKVSSYGPMIIPPRTGSVPRSVQGVPVRQRRRLSDAIADAIG